jgi:hypothetical protein
MPGVRLARMGADTGVRFEDAQRERAALAIDLDALDLPHKRSTDDDRN